MARKRPDRSDADVRMLEQASEDYQQASDLFEAVMNAACYFGDEDGFEAVWDFAEARLDRSRRAYIMACVRGGWFTR